MSHINTQHLIVDMSLRTTRHELELPTRFGINQKRFALSLFCLSVKSFCSTACYLKVFSFGYSFVWIWILYWMMVEQVVVCTRCSIGTHGQSFGFGHVLQRLRHLFGTSFRRQMSYQLLPLAAHLRMAAPRSGGLGLLMDSLKAGSVTGLM